jgi:hypothetical protein
MASISPADEVALICLRDEASVEIEGLRGLIAKIADWRCLADWEAQGILCLVADRLRSAGLLSAVPTEPRGKMKELLKEYRRIGLLYEEETQRIITALTAANIPCAILKDFRAYRDTELRPSYDLDLLVGKDDLEKVNGALADIGYQASLSALREKYVDRARDFYRFEGDLRFTIDLHWKLTNSYLERTRWTNIDTLLAERISVQACSQSIPGLALHHFLINACIHAYTHESRFPTRLIVWADIAEPLRRWQNHLDWNLIVETTKSMRCENDVYLPLRIVRDMLNVHVPTWVLDTLKPI